MTTNKCFLERLELSNDQYHQGVNLTQAHRAMIGDSREIWIIALLENIAPGGHSERFLEHLSEAFKPTDLEHYSTQRRLWAEQEFYFLNQRLGGSPDLGIFLEEANDTYLMEKCRISYALEHPEKTQLNGKPENHSLVHTFLTRAEQISGQPYVRMFFPAQSCEEIPARVVA